MPKSEFKSKSRRKPLRDVSNGVKSSKPLKIKKDPANDDKVQDDDAIDRLFLVHSDLSSLIHQIDELVVQALKVKSKEGRKEVESFTQVLSDIQASLKPWAPRFQKAISSQVIGLESQSRQSLTSGAVPPASVDASDVIQSPEGDTKFDSLVSPSPLVSWRAGCPDVGGRQLFLLTPLPKPRAFSSKLEGSSTLMETFKMAPQDIDRLSSLSIIPEDKVDDLLEGVAVKPAPVEVCDPNPKESETTMPPALSSPPTLSNNKPSVIVMTPCLKMSPPKSCVLLEPVSQLSHKHTHGTRKSTPFPSTVQDCINSEESESSSGEDSENWASKYPKFFGIQPPHKLGYVKKGVEASPGWLMSPPKTCTIMEPPDEKALKSAISHCPLPRTGQVHNQQTQFSFAKEDNVVKDQTTRKLDLGGGSALVESTPLCKEPESNFRRGKHPGENTLKKELWTKFEAATTYGILRPKAAVLQETAEKRFLDRLEEASSM